MNTTRAAIAKLLDKLETQKLTTCRRTAEDRRSVSLRLTRKGEALSVEMTYETEFVNSQFATRLTPEEVELFIIEVVRQIRTAC